MASSVYNDDSSNSSDSNLSQDFGNEYFERFEVQEDLKEASNVSDHPKDNNVIHKLISRQIYGRVTKSPRAKTEKILTHIHCQCKYQLRQLIAHPDFLSHVFMGFTLCGKFFVSYKEKYVEDVSGVSNFLPSVEYELYVWKFIPGQKLQYVAKYRIFKHLQGPELLTKIIFMQFPSDPYKLICYGSGLANPVMAFLTILTLPNPENCKYCTSKCKFEQGWCLKHGFMLHYMFSLAQPTPAFDPHISLAYPDHIVINTGHYIHILNVTSTEPISNIPTFSKDDDVKTHVHSTCHFADNASEISEAASDNFSTNSTVEAILEDFSEYDLESADCNRPFHELNISCEPLNVTGKSYHNTVVQTIINKRIQNGKDCFSVPQTSVEKPKIIDKKIAEKAYEFTEENEKCEKLSSFRKKRLADKKYEFSEDNSENIVPFNSLRRERRYFCRSRGIRSPDLNHTLFLSPRSTGSIRSPMQSPNSRHSSLRNSPHHSKSPISPRESARKFNVYSPSMDSDCSDYDSRLILRHGNERRLPESSGLLVVDNRREEPNKWIKKVVRRYSSVDFEDSSLVSGQSRDDYNIPIEIPLLVQTLTDQQLDIVPEFKADQVTETQLIITQRTFDCEQFVQRSAQKLCSESQLRFFHCEDYDIKLLHICPINGHIVCQAVIKIGALRTNVAYSKPDAFIANCIFMWNIATDAFDLVEPPEWCKLQPFATDAQMVQIDIPPSRQREVLVMDVNSQLSKSSLRDYHNCYEILLDGDDDGDDEYYW